MKITSDQKLVSSTEETLDIKITWNPSNMEEERLVSMVAVMTALINDYHRLNTLVGD